MERHFVQWADIPFIITTYNENMTPFIIGQHGGRPAGKTSGIEIKVDKNSQANDEFDYTRLPEVALNNDLMEVAHPHYRGSYSLRQGKGIVQVNGQNSLAAFLRTILPVILIDRDGLAIHSSCIKKNGRAYIFSGPSGSGKSTVVELTKKPVLYSDEITLVRKNINGVFKVYHSPFRSEIFTPYEPPTDNIAGVFFLTHNSRVLIEPMSKIKALTELMSNVFWPITGKNPLTDKIFNLCCDFMHSIPVARMHFKKDNTFWRSIDEFANYKSES